MILTPKWFLSDKTYTKVDKQVRLPEYFIFAPLSDQKKLHLFFSRPTSQIHKRIEACQMESAGVSVASYSPKEQTFWGGAWNSWKLQKTQQILTGL